MSQLVHELPMVIVNHCYAYLATTMMWGAATASGMSAAGLLPRARDDTPMAVGGLLLFMMGGLYFLIDAVRALRADWRWVRAGSGNQVRVCVTPNAVEETSVASFRVRGQCLFRIRVRATEDRSFKFPRRDECCTFSVRWVTSHQAAEVAELALSSVAKYARPSAHFEQRTCDDEVGTLSLQCAMRGVMRVSVVLEARPFKNSAVALAAS